VPTEPEPVATEPEPAPADVEPAPAEPEPAAVDPAAVEPVDQSGDDVAAQVVYLDVDGATGIAYHGPVTVEGIDIPAFAAR
jgi:hypothetical protein